MREIPIKQNSVALKVCFIFAIILFTYSTYRACVVGFTWDESFSYLNYSRNKIFMLEHLSMMDANNHLLNTWSNIFLIKLFGVNQIVLRLPSLISHILFLFYSYKIVAKLQNSLLIIFGFIIINFNPYVLDFFSLSRGYGLSLGLMMASVYWLFQYFDNITKVKSAMLAMVFALLATLANLVLFNFLIVLYSVMILNEIINVSNTKIENGSPQKNRYVLSILITLILLLSISFFVPYALKLQNANALYYGGKNGFFEDTIITLLISSLYCMGSVSWLVSAIAFAIILSMVWCTCTLMYMAYCKTLNSENKLLIAIVFILLGNIVLNLLQHYIFNTNYLVDRTAIFYIVLYSLTIIFSIAKLIFSHKKKVLIFLFISVCSVSNWVNAINFNYVLDWKLDADISEMVNDLENIKNIPHGKQNIAIGTPLEFKQSINYYRVKNRLSWLNNVERMEKIDMRYDYFYLIKSELPTSYFDSIIQLKYYPNTNTILAKPKVAFKPRNILFSGELNFGATQLQMDEYKEYSEALSCIVTDSIFKHRNAIITFKASVKTTDINNCNASMVITLENNEGAYFWTHTALNDYMYSNNTFANICYTCNLSKDIKVGDAVKCYFWNPNKNKFSIKNMAFTIVGN